MELTYWTILGVPVVYLLYYVFNVGRRPKGYPPGPPTLPLLGNIHLMPTENPHLQFEKWAIEYGPIFSLMLGTKTMIVLSNDKAVKELLDKRSANFSSRPDLYTGHELLSGNKRMVMMVRTDALFAVKVANEYKPYGSPWRTIRKLYHHALHLNKSAEYVPYEELENKQLLFELMTHPIDPLEHFRRYSTSLITGIVYGFRWPSFQDPELKEMFHNLDNYVRLNTTGGAAIADFYPILRWLPKWLSAHKREALEHYGREIKLYTNLYRQVKNNILQKTTAGPCVCEEIVALQAKEGYTDDYTSHIPAQLWEAGSDTTSTELYGFIQALLLYPEAQAKGQAELDAVVGQERMPSLDDMSRLPYVQACVKETLRWLPAAILGAFPHSTCTDDNYMGYIIPKSAIVMLNVWTIHRDPKRYPNPTKFDPARFYGDSSTAMESANSMDASRRDHFGFGAGRRICPGINVAERSMLLGIARIFWAFDVKPKIGDDGKAKLPVQDDFVPGFVAIPKQFDVVISPRSEAKRKLVVDEWEAAKGMLGADGQFLANFTGLIEKEE